MANWIRAVAVDQIDDEDVIAFAHDGVDYAIYKDASGEVFATAGHCTHERTLLCDGLVMAGVVECPKHNGRFDIRTGRPLGAPVIEALKTYPARVAESSVYIDIDG